MDAGLEDDSDDETQSTTETEDSDSDEVGDGILSDESDQEDAEDVLARATGRDGKGDIEDSTSCGPETRTHSRQKNTKLKAMLNDRQK